MGLQRDELPGDLSDVPFIEIARYLLSNGGEIKRKLNGRTGDLLLLEDNGMWYFEHPGLPGPSNQFVMRADSVSEITPKTFIR